MKSKYWAMVLAAVVVLSAAAAIPLFRTAQDAGWAEIRSNGQLSRTVNLHVDQQFTVPCPGGYNTVTVKDGKIAVTEASCPDHYCMDRGFCSGGTPIVCLPNKLVIEFTGEQEIDGLLG